ncbi:hypothetical protein [Sinorhizobium meliloti]|uniref:hypothetical protein n=1 Tax=Rhizobium meliloti TaxID=382 RepID=UPI001295ECED|nr:hypothetical protein [Sinorhizobium meliloti]MQW55277.1 hypothetical protein [Sinorhizobium meliloti]
MTRDTFIAKNVAAMGPNASATHTTFNQNFGTLQGIDMEKLAEELLSLKQCMAGQASTTEHFESLAAISAAEDAARKGDKATVLAKLKAAGSWALDAATKIGIAITTEAIKKSAGL